MSFDTPVSYLFVSAALLLLSVPLIAGSRTWILLAVNVLFVGLTLEWSRGSIVLLGLWLLVHFMVVRVMLVTPLAARRAIFVLWLLAALAAFAVVKQYWWLTDPFVTRQLVTVPLMTIGLSFVFFRQIGIAIEVRDGALAEVGALDYVNYQLAFWSFIAGPLQRFSAFVGERRKLETGPEVSGNDVLNGLNRVAFGFLKVFIVGRAISRYAVIATFVDHPNPLRLLIFLLAFPLYLYVNFSGYCDIVIGFCRAIGFGLPENFNHPYLARNINDFWSRWHITLSEFLRDYLYFPLQVALGRRIGALGGMVIAALASFLIMGIWHGNAARFAVFGLLHGVGIVAVNLYAEMLKRSLSKESLRTYRQHPAIRAGAVVVCQCYVVFTFLFFNYSAGELRLVADAMRRMVS